MVLPWRRHILSLFFIPPKVSSCFHTWPFSTLDILEYFFVSQGLAGLVSCLEIGHDEPAAVLDVLLEKLTVSFVNHVVDQVLTDAGLFVSGLGQDIALLLELVVFLSILHVANVVVGDTSPAHNDIRGLYAIVNVDFVVIFLAAAADCSFWGLAMFVGGEEPWDVVSTTKQG